jgi:hypothetical protein
MEAPPVFLKAGQPVNLERFGTVWVFGCQQRNGNAGRIKRPPRQGR